MTSPADIEKYNIKLDHVSIRGQNITIGKGIFQNRQLMDNQKAILYTRQ